MPDQPIALGFFSVPVNIRQTAATGANATVFAMRNAVGSGKEIFIERIYLIQTFDVATPLGRSLQRYSIGGFNSGTPTGGTSVTVTDLDSNNDSTVVSDVRFLDTGLTTTGLSFAPPSSIISCPATDGAISAYIRSGVPTKLGPGEGLYIRLTVAAVVGQGLCGEIVWRESNL